MTGRKPAAAAVAGIAAGVLSIAVAHEDQETAAGAEIRQEPADRPWHAREMLVADPDGHVLRIGGPAEGDH